MPSLVEQNRWIWIFCEVTLLVVCSLKWNKSFLIGLFQFLNFTNCQKFCSDPESLSLQSNSKSTGGWMLNGSPFTMLSTSEFCNLFNQLFRKRLLFFSLIEASRWQQIFNCHIWSWIFFLYQKVNRVHCVDYWQHLQLGYTVYFISDSDKVLVLKEITFSSPFLVLNDKQPSMPRVEASVLKKMSTSLGEYLNMSWWSWDIWCFKISIKFLKHSTCIPFHFTYLSFLACLSNWMIGLVFEEI
jgi:hypothetical protein